METIRYGAVGPAVYALQLALGRAGYAPGSLDGYFGRRTIDALTAFQRAGGLAPDGIVGPLTWAALYPYLTGYTVRIVREGDTIFRLAQRFGTGVAAIETANPQIDPENIPLGSELIVPFPFDVTPTDIPYSYALTMLVIEGLTARYPFIAQRMIGRSVMGKELTAVSMGAGERQVFYNASHHANEWITTPVLLRFLEVYAQAYATGGRVFDVPAADLFARATLHMVPLVNPDGVDLVTGALPDTDSYYRQARALSEFYPDIAFPSGWKANIAGVDLNLGYPAGWEEARSIKFAQGYTRPGPRDFVGSAPLAEPEDRAMYDYTLANDFRLTLSYHTQGRVIYWRYLDYDPPRAAEIGADLARVSGYALEDTPYASGFAGYKDWFIQQYNLPGYTVEAGSGENPLPISGFDEIFRDNLGILTLSLLLA